MPSIVSLLRGLLFSCVLLVLDADSPEILWEDGFATSPAAYELRQGWSDSVRLHDPAACSLARDPIRCHGIYPRATHESQ